MPKKATVIAVVNQKGGTGKSTTCENLGVGLRWRGNVFYWLILIRRHH